MKNVFRALGVIITMWALFYFLKDRSGDTPEFQKYKEDHLGMLSRQGEMEQKFLASEFKFNSLELIHIGPGERYFSRWGHIMIRFVGSGSSPSEDLAVSFLADFNDFPVNDVKAFLGGYVVLPKLETMANYHREYFHGEKRFLHSYPLNLSTWESDKLTQTLKAWVKDKSLPGSYSFMSNNCVGLVHRLFEDSGFTLKGDRSYFPGATPAFYYQAGLIKDLGLKTNLAELKYE